jgi:multicomponent Na+:H+ antiporter subunit G
MTIVGGVLIGLGCGLTLLAGIGVLRFPDVLMRANASTKAAGLGVACVLAGVAFMVATPSAAIKLSVAVLLQFATAPLAGHVIGRGAYRSGAPLWAGTHIDDLRAYEITLRDDR